MLREVSDLSFGSFSEDAEPDAASSILVSASFKPYRSSQDGSWKTYTNTLEDTEEQGDITSEGAAQQSDALTNELSSSRAQVRFNTAFETDQILDEELPESVVPTTWSACDTADLGIIAAHLAAAALPSVQQASNHSSAAISSDPAVLLLHIPLEAEDMLGLGLVDLRTCTLSTHVPAAAATPRFCLEASFSRAAQVR